MQMQMQGYPNIKHVVLPYPTDIVLNLYLISATYYNKSSKINQPYVDGRNWNAKEFIRDSYEIYEI